jgi:hypothetical protein
MKSAGSILIGIGALIGVAVGLGMIAGVSIPGVSWFIAVGLVKLTLMAAVGFMAAGATLIRLARRAEKRERIARPEPTEKPF